MSLSMQKSICAGAHRPCAAPALLGPSSGRAVRRAPVPRLPTAGALLDVKAIRSAAAVDAGEARLTRTRTVAAAAQTLPQTDDAREFAVAVASMLNDTKCQDIVVLDVSPLVSWTSYMVFCSVFSKPQLQAALARVEKMGVEKYTRQQQNTPGNSPWECLDYGDCLVHIMSVDQREYYDVESFYATAEEVELPFEQQQPSPEMQAPQWTRQQSNA